MKKLLVFHQVGGRGGATITLSNVVACLSRSGFDITVLCPAGEGQRSLSAAGAKVITPERPIRQFTHLSGFEKPAFHPRFCLDASRQLLDLEYWTRTIQRLGPDIVHLNAITLAPLAMAAKNAGAQVSLMIQETGVHGALGIRTAWLRRIISRHVDLVVFISEFDRNWFDLQGPRIGVIPNWVDEREFGPILPRSDARAELKIPADAQVVLFLGGVCPLKGAVHILKAVHQLRDMDKLILLIAGEKRLIQPRKLSRIQRLNRNRRIAFGLDYDRQIASALRLPGVRRRVRLVGQTRHVSRLYSATDIVVFPATKPHQARPAIEAGYVNRPVIASSFDNVREFLRNGENAILVEPCDPMALASAIRNLFQNPELMDRLGKANRKQVDRFHNRELNTALLAKLFQETFVSNQ